MFRAQIKVIKFTVWLELFYSQLQSPSSTTFQMCISIHAIQNLSIWMEYILCMLTLWNEVQMSLFTFHQTENFHSLFLIKAKKEFDCSLYLWKTLEKRKEILFSNIGIQLEFFMNFYFIHLGVEKPLLFQCKTLKSSLKMRLPKKNHRNINKRNEFEKNRPKPYELNQFRLTLVFHQKKKIFD